MTGGATSRPGRAVPRGTRPLRRARRPGGVHETDEAEREAALDGVGAQGGLGRGRVRVVPQHQPEGAPGELVEQCGAGSGVRHPRLRQEVAARGEPSRREEARAQSGDQ
ncbi:hypothetical protein QBA54_09665 [Streptomyces sp. B21-108]|uniref:hypothetical protein n=1 Tax=Streptomyces sp. B21-108 TaxID=3039419 RepID=UPI002FF117BE